ncbi:hypothetical protein JI435_416100, partial [Parastagonospora nodorum SN15]
VRTRCEMLVSNISPCRSPSTLSWQLELVTFYQSKYFPSWRRSILDGYQIRETTATKVVFWPSALDIFAVINLQMVISHGSAIYMQQVSYLRYFARELVMASCAVQ